MAQNQGTSTSTHSAGGTSGSTSKGMGGQGTTGVQDSTYNVISVVYHTLQGAETIQKYLRDAQGGQDREVEQFLREAQDQYKRLAQRGRECLAQMLHQQGGASGQQMQGGSQSGQQGQGSSGGRGQQSQSSPSSGQWGGGVSGSGQQSQGGSSSGQMGGGSSNIHSGGQHSQSGGGSTGMGGPGSSRSGR